MNVYFAAVLAGLAGIALRTAEPLAPSSAQDEQALRHLKTVDWPRAYREQDTVLLDRLLAPEFRVIDAEGNWSSKAEEIAYLRRHRMTHDSFRYAIRRLQIFDGGRTALVAGTGTARGTNAQGPYAFRYHSSNFFVKRQGRWQAVASHISGSQKLPPDTAD